MARIPRSQLTPGWFHCINRGVNRNTIFFDDHDYHCFKNELLQMSLAHGLTIAAYCLMPNHWHIVLECLNIDALSSLFQALQNSHTKRHHSKYGSIGYGPIYQGRFKSIPIANETALGSICEYVELNPVRASLVSQSFDWQWSSARGQSGA